MSWAQKHIAALQKGNTATFRPKGGSMKPHIESGQRVTVRPLKEHEPAAGDIVLCTVKGRDYLHFVGVVQGERYRIQNAKGRQNGWIGRNKIYGVLSHKE